MPVQLLRVIIKAYLFLDVGQSLKFSLVKALRTKISETKLKCVRT